jgi:pyrimidine-nucleoside phosphorylase
VGRKTVAVISDMNQPLGRAIGNALEVKEAIETLTGNGPEDLTELAVTIGAHMLLLGGLVSDVASGRVKLEEIIRTGQAVEKLAQMVKAQGGDERDVYDPSRLPQAKYIWQLTARDSGYIAGIDAEMVGHASVVLGAGRMTKEQPIDLAVGIVLHKKAGDPVEKGETLASIHANDEQLLEQAKRELDEAFTYSKTALVRHQLIYDIIE